MNQWKLSKILAVLAKKTRSHFYDENGSACLKLRQYFLQNLLYKIDLPHCPIYICNVVDHIYDITFLVTLDMWTTQLERNVSYSLLWWDSNRNLLPNLAPYIQPVVLINSIFSYWQTIVKPFACNVKWTTLPHID